jgi:hypothetical protein
MISRTNTATAVSSVAPPLLPLADPAALPPVAPTPYFRRLGERLAEG